MNLDYVRTNPNCYNDNLVNNTGLLSQTRICRGNIFFNSESNVFYPFSVLRNSIFDSSFSKAIGCDVISSGNPSKCSKRDINRFIASISSQLYNPIYYTAKNSAEEIIKYFLNSHMIYTVNYTEDSYITDFKYLLLLCVRSDKINHIVTNGLIDPRNYILMIDSSCLTDHKSVKSVAKLYTNIGIDVMYTHSILSNFKTYNRSDMTNVRSSIDNVLSFTYNELGLIGNSEIDASSW